MEELKCNLCGQPLDQWDVQNDFVLHRKIGFGSDYDTEELKLQLCNSCLDSLVARCEVTPLVEYNEE